MKTKTLLKYIYEIIILLILPMLAQAAVFPGQEPRGGGCGAQLVFVDPPPYYTGRTYAIDATFRGECAHKRGDVLLWVDSANIIVARVPLSKNWNMTRITITIPEGGSVYGLSGYVFPGGKLSFTGSGGTTIQVKPDPLKNPAPPPATKPPPPQNPPPPAVPPPPPPTTIPPPPQTEGNTSNDEIDSNETSIGSGEIIESPSDITSLGELIVRIIRYLLIFIGALATLFIIIGGLKMVTSAGNEKAITSGKQTVQWAIVGLVVSIVSFTIVALLQNLLARQ